MKYKAIIFLISVMTKVAFFNTRDYERVLYTKLNDYSKVKIHFFESGLKDHISLLKGYEVIIADSEDDLSAPVLDALYNKGVELIALRYRGLNRIDLKSAYQKIRVIRPDLYPIEGAAEFAIESMLCLHRSLDTKALDGKSAIKGLRDPLKGKTVGVFGCGRLGKQIAKLARGMQMPVLLYDLHHDNVFAKDQGCEYVEAQLLYKKSDIIFFNVPINEATQSIIDAKILNSIKEQACLISMSPSSIYNLEDLYSALKKGHIAGLAMDLLEEDEFLDIKNSSLNYMSNWWIDKLEHLSNVSISKSEGVSYLNTQRYLAQNILADINNFIHHNPLSYEVRFQKVIKSKK